MIRILLDRSPTYFNCSHIWFRKSTLSTYKQSSKYQNQNIRSLFVGRVGCPGGVRPTGSCRTNRHCNSWSYCYRPGGQGLVGYCCAWKRKLSIHCCFYILMDCLIFYSILFSLQKDHINHKRLTDSSTNLRDDKS